MIDKKRLIKSLIIISLLIIIIFVAIQIRKTLARYETTTTTQRDVDVAFWVVDNSFKSQRLIIDDIYPLDTSFDYTFTVSNFDPGPSDSDTDDKIAETDMEYELVLTTTTNLPLSYEITRNGVTYTELQQELFQDVNGTVYREIRFGTTENPYPLTINTIVPELDGEGNATGDNIKTRITDTYILKVKFPLQSEVNGEVVNNRENPNYADLMEDIKIDLTARQKID